jgi:hypothetical protein
MGFVSAFARLQWYNWWDRSGLLAFLPNLE